MKQTTIKEENKMLKKLLKMTKEALDAPMGYKDVSPWNNTQVH